MTFPFNDLNYVVQIEFLVFLNYFYSWKFFLQNFYKSFSQKLAICVIMLKNQKYQVYKLKKSIRTATLKSHFLKYLLFLGQFACLLLLLLMKLQPHAPQVLKNNGQIFKKWIDTQVTVENATKIAAFSNFLYFGLIVSIVIKLKMIPNYDEGYKNTKFSKLLLAFVIIMGWISQLTGVIFSWSISQIFQVEGEYKALTICIFPILSFIYYNLHYGNQTIFGILTIPVIFAIDFIQNAFPLFALAFLSIFFICTSELILMKISYSLILIALLFTAKVLYFDQEITGDNLRWLYLGLLAVSFTLYIWIKRERYSIFNTQKQIKKIINILEQLNFDLPSSKMKFQEFFRMYAFTFSLSINHKKEVLPQSAKILRKKAQELSKKQFLIMLKYFIQRQMKKQTKSHINYLLLQTKIHLLLNEESHQIFQQFYNLNTERKKSDKKHSDEFFEIFDQVIEKYGSFRRTNFLESTLVMQIQAQRNLFETNTVHLLEKLEFFWKMLNKKVLKLSELNNFYQEILYLEQNMEKSFQELKNEGTFDKESKIFRSLKHLINPYKLNQQNPSRLIGTSETLKDDLADKNYIILQNNVIKFISRNFKKNLKQNNVTICQDQNIQHFFGENFSGIYQNLIKNISKQTQSKWITMPFTYKEQLVELKNIKIIWCPSLEVKDKFMMKIIDAWNWKDDSLLIYYEKSDIIKSFNSNFIKKFYIDEEKFQFLLSNNQLSFNEIFRKIQESPEQIKKILKSQGLFRCSLHLKKLTNRKMFADVPVEIEVVKQLSISEEQAFCYLKITRQKDKNQNIEENPKTQDLNGTIGNITMKNIIADNQVLAKKNANQRFFCKIQNSYETKIIEKQRQLQESGRFTYRLFIHILFGLIVLMCLAYQAIDYSLLKTRINEYKTVIATIEDTSEQYALLYQAYSIMLKRYYVERFSDQTEKFRKIPAEEYDKVLVNLEQSILDQFIEKYLTQANSHLNSKINFTIDFARYSVQTDTEKSSLMDFAEKFRKNIVTKDKEFLLKNYNNFRNLTINFEHSASTNDQVARISENSEIYQIIFILSVTLSLLAAVMAILRIQKSIMLVYSIIEEIPMKQLSQGFKTFTQRKNKILSMLDLRTEPADKMKTKNLKSQTREERPGTILPLKSPMNKQIEKIQSVFSTRNNKFPYKEKRVRIQNQLSPLEKTENLQQTDIDETDQEFSSIVRLRRNPSSINSNGRKQKIIDEPIIQKLKRHILFVIFMVGIIAVFLFDHSRLRREQKAMVQILSIKQKIYIALMHVKREEVDAPIIPAMKTYYNQSIIDNFHPQKIDLVTDMPNHIIFSEMNNFLEKAEQILEGDLCQFIGVYKMAALKPCNTYFNGMVAKGFRQTHDIYLASSKALAKQSMSQFGEYDCTAQKCPLFHQCEVGSILLGETIREVIKVFNKETEKLFATLIDSKILEIIVKATVLFFCAIGYVLHSIWFRIRCRLVLKFFQIIPKDILCNMKITTFLKKKNFLDELSIL